MIWISDSIATNGDGEATAGEEFIPPPPQPYQDPELSLFEGDGVDEKEFGVKELRMIFWDSATNKLMCFGICITTYLLMH